MRRFLLVFGIAAASVAAAALGGFGFIQTGPGKAWLAWSLSRGLSSHGRTVAVTGIEGTVPFNMRVREIRVMDRDGAWLTVSDTKIDIAGGELLRRRLTVRRLAVGDITVARSPSIGISTPPDGSRSISIPDLPIDTAIQTLSVARLRLEEPVLGERITAALVGSGRLYHRTADAQLSIERLDADGHARLAFRSQLPNTATLHIDIAEPSGRLIMHALGRHEPLPLAVTVSGEGSVDLWHGRLLASAGDAVHMEANVALRNDGGYRMVSDGTLTLAGLLPVDVARAIPDPLRFDVTAALNGEVVRVETLTLSAGAITFRGTGGYDIAGQAFAGAGTATIYDLGSLAALVDAPLAGTANAMVEADGTLGMFRARIMGSARDLKSGALGAGRLSATVHAQQDNGRWRLMGNGTADALSWPVANASLPQRLDWEVSAVSNEAFSTIAADRVLLRSGETEIDASGAIEMLDRAPQIKANARLTVANLAQWEDLAGMPLSGRLAVEIHAATEVDAVTARLAGRGEDLAFGQAALEELLGDKVVLNGLVRRSNRGEISFDGVRIEAAHLTASADATIAADLSGIQVTARAQAPRLDVLSRRLGVAVEGAMTANAHVGGELSRPRVSVQAAATGLLVDARPIEHIAADLTLTNAAAPTGAIAVTLRTGQLDVRANADFARTSWNTLSISNLSAAAPGAEATGALDLRTDTLLVTGDITARVADLSPWSVLAGTGLAGSVKGRVALRAKSGQDVDIDASALNLRVDYLNAVAASAKIGARLTGLSGSPSGHASIDGAAVTMRGLRADRVRFVANSSKPGLFTVQLDTQGVLYPASDPGAFRLSAAGDIAIGNGEQRLRLARLSGRVGAYEIASEELLVITIGTDRLQIDGLDLRIGQAQLVGSASRMGERLSLKAELRDLPLVVLGAAAPAQKISGALSGTVAVAGTVARPEGQFEARLRDLRLAAGREIPPLTVISRGKWRDARLDLTGHVAGPDRTALDVDGSLPLVLDPSSFVPVTGDGPVRLGVRSKGRLESWSAALPLGDDRLSGQYAIDMLVHGTLASPEAGGRLTIKDGRYVSFAAGTELRNFNLELVGEGRRLTLIRLAATDTGAGTITGRGFIDLAAAPAAVIDFSAAIARFQAIRRDDFTATADGELRLAGTVNSATLSGRIRGDRAELRIPERLPPNIPRLDVIEVDSRRGEVLGSPEMKPSEAALRLDIDVHQPARAFVRGRSLDSEWRGDLHITGTVGAPVLSGKLEMVRGNLSLLGKRFVFSDSTIRFDGGENIDPQLDITAEHRAGEIVAQVLVTGAASNPTIRLTSRPELPEDEVLARVLFGRSVRQITPLQGVQLAEAAAILAGRGGVLDGIRTAVRLDRLDISSGETSGDSRSGGTVTAGRYLTDRVFFGVEQGTGQASTRSRVEVEVTPNVFLGSGFSNSSGGIGVDWRWDY